MSDLLRKLGSQTALYAGGTILARALGFLLLPVYSNLLGTSPFGDYTLLYVFLAFGNVALLWGMDAAFLRFYVLEKDPERRRQIFSTCFYAISTLSVVLGSLIFLTAGWWAQVLLGYPDHPVYTGFLRFAAVILTLDAVTMAGLLLHRAHQQGGKFMIVRLLSVLVNFAGNIYFVVILHMEVSGILLANVLGSATGLLLVLPTVTRYLRPMFSLTDLRAMARFGLPYVFPGIAMIAMEMLGRLQIDYYLTRSDTAVFSANYRLGIFLSLLVAGYRMAWQPFFLSQASDPGAKALFAKILTWCTAGLVWGFLVVGLLASELVMLPLPGGYHFLAPAYWDGMVIIPWVLGGYVFYAWYVNFMAGIYIERQSRWLPLVTGVGALAHLLLNTQLIPAWGIVGAAVSGCLSYGVMAGLLWWVCRRFYPVPYDYRRLALICAIGLLLFMLGYWEGVHTPLALKILVIGVYPLVLLGSGMVSRQEIMAVWRVRSSMGTRGTDV